MSPGPGEPDPRAPWTPEPRPPLPLYFQPRHTGIRKAIPPFPFPRITGGRNSRAPDTRPPPAPWTAGSRRAPDTRRARGFQTHHAMGTATRRTVVTLIAHTARTRIIRSLRPHPRPGRRGRSGPVAWPDAPLTAPSARPRVRHTPPRVGEGVRQFVRILGDLQDLDGLLEFLRPAPRGSAATRSRNAHPGSASAPAPATPAAPPHTDAHQTYAPKQGKPGRRPAAPSGDARQIEPPFPQEIPAGQEVGQSLLGKTRPTAGAHPARVR